MIICEDREPLVSIIMNCFNGEKYIKDAIESVEKQTYSNWELIVWDNLSTDMTAKIVTEFAVKNDKIKYFLAENFTALGEARNLAIRQSGGDYIAFLDCDDLWMPNKLSEQIPIFQKNKAIGIVYSDSMFFDDMGDKERLFKNIHPSRGHCFDSLLNNYPISLETAIITRRAIEGMHSPFDKNFNMVEEYDLFVRVGLDWEIDYSHKVLAKWRIHNKSWTWTKKNHFFIEKKKMYDGLEDLLRQRGFEGFINSVAKARKNLMYSNLKYLLENNRRIDAKNFIYASDISGFKKVFFLLALIIPKNYLIFIGKTKKYFFG